MKQYKRLLALLLVLTLALTALVPAFAEDGAPAAEQTEEAVPDEEPGQTQEAAEPAEEAAVAGESPEEEPADAESALPEGGEREDPPVSPLVCGEGESLSVAEGAVICEAGGVVFNNGATV